MAGAKHVLVTGGTGKTGRAVVNGLRNRGVAYKVGARSPGDAEFAVRFDWMDSATHAPALAGVDAVYLVAPIGVLDPVPVMSAFIDEALTGGVRRFVLLSSSAITIDGPAMGQVHRVLADKAPEWAVLQPSWFMQNFTEGHHGDTIRREGAIYSATGDAAVAFIDANDIGETGAACLCADQPLNDGVILTGPSSLSYDEVAALISAQAGRAIEHVKLEVADLARRFNEFGLDADYSQFLAQLDAFLAGGSEARTTSGVAEIAGREPVTFLEFAEASKGCWVK